MTALPAKQRVVTDHSQDRVERSIRENLNGLLERIA